MLKKDNSTSSDDRRNTDLLAISPHMQPAAILADATVSCPYTATYVVAASASSHAVLDARALEKRTNIGPAPPPEACPSTHSCGPIPVPLVLTPLSTLALLRSYFAVTAAFELAEGHYNPPSRALYSQLWHKLQVSLARSVHHSISSLVAGPPI